MLKNLKGCFSLLVFISKEFYFIYFVNKFFIKQSILLFFSISFLDICNFINIGIIYNNLESGAKIWVKTHACLYWNMFINWIIIGGDNTRSWYGDSKNNSGR